MHKACSQGIPLLCPPPPDAEVMMPLGQNLQIGGDGAAAAGFSGIPHLQ